MIYTFPRGTPIPLQFIFSNDSISRFSLQLHVTQLDEFYNTRAQKEKESAEKWLNAHPYREATVDDAEAVWMTM